MGQDNTSYSSPMKDVRGYFPYEIVREIVEVCPDKRFALIFEVLARTGRRVSEVVRSLKPMDIDFNTGLVKWRILKRKKKYDVKGNLLPAPTDTLPIGDDLKQKLANYIVKHSIASDDFVFPFSPQYVDRKFKMTCKCLKNPILTWGSLIRNKPHVHILRHSFAVRRAKKMKSPEDLKKLQNMLGHANIGTTMHYLKYNPEEMKTLLEGDWD